jgi:DNA (cytosine-5)-methyltransferase 1
MKVIDFFCGAGGFSEGFRQMGYEIEYGYDHWRPAVETFNYNFGLECEQKNILDFLTSIDEIDSIPNTEIIIGSPPCVSFSSSNKSGKADKSLGLDLTKAFLRVVAVKKNQPNSILAAWYMENVVNSTKFLNDSYTFIELDLKDWAIKNGILPTDIAIEFQKNTTIINSADYGSFQARKRAISGEIISKGRLIIPKTSHSKQKKEVNQEWRTLGELLDIMPSTKSKLINSIIADPNSLSHKIHLKNLTDHFYDTGIYESEWRQSKFYKTNHPFMGKMSFPERLDSPSRTITATKSSTSRESIIYKSEFSRIGDGEYRSPTIREVACIMGFPISHQFLGSVNTKWRLVGNAVCVSVSKALATQVLLELNCNIPKSTFNKFDFVDDDIINLNTFSERIFDKQPIRTKKSRFRRHPIKSGNLTVTLSNYDISKNDRHSPIWHTSVQYGTGKGFPIQTIPDNYYKVIEPIIASINGGANFIEIMNNGFSGKIGSKSELQFMYEYNINKDRFIEPTRLIEEVSSIINNLIISHEIYEQDEVKIFKNKDVIPLNQLFSLYAVNFVCSRANSKK